MKALLLATAILATPLFAQMTSPADPAPPATAPADPAPPATTPTTTTADPAMTTSATTGTDAAAANGQAAATATANATTPPPPGVTPVFQQPPTVDQAYPAPPPKANYPWCSKTVTDGCKQRYDPK